MPQPMPNFTTIIQEPQKKQQIQPQQQQLEQSQQSSNINQESKIINQPYQYKSPSIAQKQKSQNQHQKECSSIECKQLIYKKIKSKVKKGNKYRLLCKQCYQNYFEKRFCWYCDQTYKIDQTEGKEDQILLSKCINCQMFIHKSCLKNFRRQKSVCKPCSYQLNRKVKKSSKSSQKSQRISPSQQSQTKQYQQSTQTRILRSNPLKLSKKIEQIPQVQQLKFKCQQTQNLQKESYRIFDTSPQHMKILENNMLSYMKKVPLTRTKIIDDITNLRKKSKDKLHSYTLERKRKKIKFI